MDLDTSRWKRVGRTTGSAYFEVEPGFLLVLPDEGAQDTVESATEEKAFQLEYCARVGGRTVVGILFDRVVDQTKGAREVYKSWPPDGGMVGSALIGGTVLARAMISFFQGLTQTDIPVRTFATMDDALVWSRTLTGR
jgi:hypothetical protein